MATSTTTARSTRSISIRWRPISDRSAPPTISTLDRRFPSPAQPVLSAPRWLRFFGAVETPEDEPPARKRPTTGADIIAVIGRKTRPVDRRHAGAQPDAITRPGTI